MAQTIKLKRKTGATGAPATTDLELGELAINAFDGKLYLKKDNGTESIVEVGGGSLTLDDVTTNGNTTTNAITVGGFTSTGIDDNATTTQFTLSNLEATFGAIVKAGGFLITGTAYGMISSGQFTSKGIDDNASQTALTIDSNNISYFSTGTAGSSPTETVINRWAASSDIDGLLPGSTSGPIIEGGWQSHLVLGIRDNDVNDGVYIVSGSGNYATDSTYDKVVASFKADGNTALGTITAGVWNGSVIASAYLDADTAHLSGTQTFTGTKNFNTSTNTVPLNISRLGSNSNQTLQIGVTDGQAIFNYIEDTTTEGTGNYGTYKFQVSGDEGTSPTVDVLTLDENVATFAGNISSPGATLTGLSNQASEATALMINGSNVVGTRELGSNAFNSTAFTTNTGTVTSVSGSNGISGTVTTTGSLSLDSDLRGHAWQIGRDTNDYFIVNTTTHSWYLDGTEDMRLTNGGSLHVEGNITAYSTTVSDARLKDNVETIENGLEKVCALRGVSYDWNAGSRKGQRDIGVIAQEVQQVVPEVVREVKDSLINGGDYLSVGYDQLVPVLIEAIKELKAEIDALKGGQ